MAPRHLIDTKLTITGLSKVRVTVWWLSGIGRGAYYIYWGKQGRASSLALYIDHNRDPGGGGGLILT